MKAYYHINKDINCKWNIGDEIDFEGKDNYYWKSLVENGDFIELNGKEYNADLVARKAFSCYVGKETPPKEMNGYHFNPLRTLQETIDSLGNALRINRELIFESIRKEYYPELPSRHKCIWLMPYNDKSLEFWKKVIQGNQHRVFKVNTEGKIHRSSQKPLIGGTFSIKIWNMQAHEYWNGKDFGNYDDEILFEGKMKIIEEITVPNKV